MAEPKHPLNYYKEEMEYHVKRMMEEYDVVANKYAATTNIVKGQPLKLKAKYPSEPNYGKWTRENIEKFLTDVDAWEFTCIALYGENDIIINNNSATKMIAIDFLKKIGMKEQVWAIPKGKRSFKWVQSDWMIELSKTFPTHHDFTEKDISSSANSMRAKVEEELRKIASTEKDVANAAAAKEACLLKIKKIGGIISKYDLPIESTEHDIIAHLFKLNPFLRMTVVMHGDDYIEKENVIHAFGIFKEDMKEYFDLDFYKDIELNVISAIGRYEDEGQDVFIDGKWNSVMFFNQANQYNSDIVRDYQILRPLYFEVD